MFDRILTDVVVGGVKEIFLYILHVLGVLNVINTRFIHTWNAGLYLASIGVGGASLNCLSLKESPVSGIWKIRIKKTAWFMYLKKIRIK